MLIAETVAKRCYKKGVFKKFATFTGKQLCKSHAFNKFVEQQRTTAFIIDWSRNFH